MLSIIKKGLKKDVQEKEKDLELEEAASIQVFFTYLCYTILDFFGHLREFLRKTGLEKRKGASDINKDVKLNVIKLYLKVNISVKRHTSIIILKETQINFQLITSF